MPMITDIAHKRQPLPQVEGEKRERNGSWLKKRPSDAEGRYRYGLTLHELGREEEAAAEMRACIEAVRTSPAYKYRTEKHWASEAQSFLRTQGEMVRNV